MNKLFRCLSGVICMGHLYWLAFGDYKFSNGWSFFTFVLITVIWAAISVVFFDKSEK